MAAPGFTPCPSRTKMQDANGNLTLPWVQWFDSVFSQSANTTGATDDAATDSDSPVISLTAFELMIDEQIVLNDSRNNARLAEALTQVQSEIAGARAQLLGMATPSIDELRAQIALAGAGYQGEENARITSLETRIALLQDAGGSSGAGQASVIYDTHANRANYSAAVFANTLYVEVDKGLLYYSKPGSPNAWAYLAGQFVTAQAGVAAFAASLVAADAGTQIYVSAPYNHLLAWSGSALAFGPGDAGSAYVQQFLTGVSPGSGWQTYISGNPATYLLGTGATATVASLPTYSPVTGYSAFFRL